MPKHYQRIRHFGFLANACRQKALSIIRKALKAIKPELSENTEEPELILICPHCKKGHLIPHHELMPVHHAQWIALHPG